MSNVKLEDYKGTEIAKGFEIEKGGPGSGRKGHKTVSLARTDKQREASADYVLPPKHLAKDIPASVTGHSKWKEYVTEAVHQDGKDYWKNFKSGKGIADDFRLYVKNS